MDDIKETDRRPAARRVLDDRRRDIRRPDLARPLVPDGIEHHLRMYLELEAQNEEREAETGPRAAERLRLWERGFEAGVEAANAYHARHLARGTRDLVRPDEEITAPYPVIDPDII